MGEGPRLDLDAGKAAELGSAERTGHMPLRGYYSAQSDSAQTLRSWADEASAPTSVLPLARGSSDAVHAEFKMFV